SGWSNRRSNALLHNAGAADGKETPNGAEGDPSAEEVNAKLTRMLQERDAGLRRAQLLAKLGHVITTPDGGFESWSETMPELIGVDPTMMPRSTRDWLHKLHPDDRRIFRATALEAATNGSRAEVEYRLQRADGTWVH